MKKYLVDTNVLLRLFLSDNQTQNITARKLFEKAHRRELELVIPQIVIFEIHFALQKYYNHSKEDIIDKLKSLISTEYLEIESKNIFIRAVSTYARSSNSFVDCFLLAKSQTEGYELFTFPLLP